MDRVHCGMACLLFAGLLLFAGCAQTAKLGKDTHIAFLIGADEYNPEVSMPDLAKEMRSRFGTTCTLLYDKNTKSIWKPKPNQRLNDFPGLGSLADADLVVFFLRFRTLREEQLDLIQAYIDAGKSVVGFRTSTHAFNYGKGDPLREKWNAFGTNVLGAPCRGPSG